MRYMSHSKRMMAVVGNITRSNMKHWIPSSISATALALHLTFVPDANAGSFVTTGSLLTGRFLQTATLLSDGRVLIAGGLPNTGATTNGAELYDSTTGQCQFTASMNVPRYAHT